MACHVGLMNWSALLGAATNAERYVKFDSRTPEGRSAFAQILGPKLRHFLNVGLVCRRSEDNHWNLQFGSPQKPVPGYSR